MVGGTTRDGKDATNDLTYIALDAYADVSTVQPNFGVRFSAEAPDDLYRLAVGYSRSGVLLHFFNDRAVIKSLTRAGHTLEDARDYGPVVVPGNRTLRARPSGRPLPSSFNGAKCLEFALSNGVDNIFGFQSGLETGDPAGFTSFDDVWQAYTTQVEHFVSQFVRGIHCLDQAIAEMLPSPFASAMIEGPSGQGPGRHVWRCGLQFHGRPAHGLFKHC